MMLCFKPEMMEQRQQMRSAACHHIIDSGQQTLKPMATHQLRING